MTPDHLPEIHNLIRAALAEDIGDGDATTNAIIPADKIFRGKFYAKAEGIVAGLLLAEATFRQLDPGIKFSTDFSDGDAVKQGDILAEIEGNARAILSAERVALNILQRMSGVATQTNRLVREVSHTRARILDTRKTVPGLRLIDKMAVKMGGGVNHRIGLFDMVMIKDNHITVAGGIGAAVSAVRKNLIKPLPIEVEVKNHDELREALALNVDRIMLDNMSVADMREAVKIAGGKIPLEASGNVSLETVRAIAETGVDFISVGQLTHSVKALDISLLLEE